MRLYSYVSSGKFDCGFKRDGSLYSLAAHPRLQALNPHQRLSFLLALSPGERGAILRETPASSSVSPGPRLAAVPHCPLYLMAHANNPTVWKRQLRQPWEMTRVPYLRVRPFTSFAGDHGEVCVPPGAEAAGGAEFAIVIGSPAYRIPRESAAAHIAGIVVQNDVYIKGAHSDFLGDPAAIAVQNQGLDTLYKGGDGHGPFGPCLMTAEDLEEQFAARFDPSARRRYAEKGGASWLYDRRLFTRVDGKLLDEAHSSAYLFGAEDMIAYLSRFMTLPTGAVIGLGAAGWDGTSTNPGVEPGSTATTETQIEGIEPLTTVFRRLAPGQETQSPFLNFRHTAGLPVLPDHNERPGRSIWVLRGNYQGCEQAEGLPAGLGMNPLLYPPLSLQADTTAPLVVPPHATTLKFWVGLAGVIGRPVYRATIENALDALAGTTLLTGMRDESLSAPLRHPTPYELRGCYFLGSCGDGFLRLGPLQPVPKAREFDRKPLRLEVDGVGRAAYQPVHYRRSLADLIAMITRLTTLLPGDIVALGALGPELEAGPEIRLHRLSACAEGNAELTVAIDDRRDPSKRDLAVR